MFEFGGSAAQYVSIERQIEDLMTDVDELNTAIDVASESAALQAGEIIKKAMMSLVPKRTRFLHDHIKVWISKSKKSRKTVEIGLDFSETPKLKYGLYQEFGRKSGRSKSGRKVGAMTAQPFIRPALTTKKDEALALAEKLYKEALDEFISKA